MSLARRDFLKTSTVSLLATGSAVAAGDKVGQAEDPRFIIAALAALNRNGQLDEGMVKDYLAYLEEGGVDAVLVNGSTGEFASFSAEERKRNLELYLRHRGRMGGACHVGAPSLPETLDLLRHAEGEGVDWVLVLPPYYYKKPSVDGLMRYFEPVLDAAKVPVLLYNIPQVSGIEIPLELVRRLEEHPRLHGIKDSWGKAQRTSAYIREFPSLKIYTGASALIGMVLKQGGAGALTGNGNIYPRQTVAIFDAYRRNGDVRVPQEELNSLVDLLRVGPIIPVMKFVLGEMGIGPMSLRPPFTELSSQQKKTLLARLKGAGILS